MKKWIAIISIGTTALVALELYLRFKDKKYWNEVERSIPWDR